MGLIVDTSVFVHAERAKKNIDFRRWDRFGEIAVSAITAAELLVGVHRADSPARRANRLAFVEGVLAAVKVVDYTLDVARVHAELLATLVQRGQMIGPYDLIVAATALCRGAAVLTSNVDEFARVPNLQVLNLFE